MAINECCMHKDCMLNFIHSRRFFRKPLFVHHMNAGKRARAWLNTLFDSHYILACKRGILWCGCFFFRCMVFFCFFAVLCCYWSCCVCLASETYKHLYTVTMQHPQSLVQHESCTRCRYTCCVCITLHTRPFTCFQTQTKKLTMLSINWNLIITFNHLLYDFLALSTFHFSTHKSIISSLPVYHCTVMFILEAFSK